MGLFSGPTYVHVHTDTHPTPPHDGSPTTQLLYKLRVVPMQPGRAQGSLQEGIQSQDHRLPGMVSWGGQQKQLLESVHHRLKVVQLSQQKKVRLELRFPSSLASVFSSTWGSFHTCTATEELAGKVPRQG